VSRLTGMNSDATRDEAQSVSAKTAPQDALAGPESTSHEAVEIVMPCPLPDLDCRHRI
jgi:hypothetical protein